MNKQKDFVLISLQIITRYNQNKMEFTPIGYIKGKQSSTTTTQTNLSPKRLDLNNISKSRISNDYDDTHDEEEEDDDMGPLRKQRRYNSNNPNDKNNNNNTSLRLFNDASQFDDTIPELQNNTNSQTQNNILPAEFNNNTNNHDIISNNNISNPIKQQQKRIETLVRTVAMLKMKNDVLIDILKQDDPNKLDTNLKLIDDLSREKDKNNILTKDNNQLQLEVNNLKDQLINTTTNSDNNINDDRHIHEDCNKQQNILKTQLEQNKIEINNLNARIKSLQNELNEEQKSIDNTNLQTKQINDEKLLKLETEITKLSSSETKHLQEIKSLNLKLKQSQEILQDKEVSFKNQLNDLQNEKDSVKNNLQLEINQYKIKIDSLTKEINDFQNNITSQDDLINKQNNTKTQLIKCQKDLDSKIEELESLKTVLSVKTKTVNELETNNLTLSQNIDDLIIKYKNQLNNKQSQIDNLNLDLEKIQLRYDNKVQQQNESLNQINDLKKKIIELEQIISTHKDELSKLTSKDNIVQLENDQLKQEIANLKIELIDNKEAYQSVKEELDNILSQYKQSQDKLSYDDNEIVSLREKLDDLTDQVSIKTKLVTEKENELARLIRQSSQFKDERTHLNDTINSKNDKLTKANERIKSLENQLFQATIKTSDETLNIINTKNNEIQSLKNELNKINKELDKTLKTNNLIESKLSKKHQSKIKDLQDEIKLLNDMLGSKNEEYDNSIHRLNAEIDDWRQRYNSLNDTLQKQLEEMHSSTSSSSSSERERQSKEIDQLMKNRSDLLKHIDKLESDLHSLQRDNDQLKLENKKIKESHSKLSDGMGKLLNKYRERKIEFNNKLMDLENENIRLDRLVENEKLKNYTRQNDNSFSNIDNTSSIQQDVIEYYRLKYYREIRRNNDQKVKNEYLKNVLNATMQQMEIDSARIKRELDTTSSPRYNGSTSNYLDNEFNRLDRPHSANSLGFNNIPARYLTTEARIALRHRLRIRIVAILSCLKIKQIAEENNKYNRRLEYLDRRIRNQRDMIRDDRFSW